MYADGTMATILKQWSLSDFALPAAAGGTPAATPAAA
jgi:hypothetical protein